MISPRLGLFATFLASFSPLTAADDITWLVDYDAKSMPGESWKVTIERPRSKPMACV